MKFKSLKLITAVITGFTLSAFIIACNDESGNNSSTSDTSTDTSKTKDNSSSTSPAVSGESKTTKKTGKASTKMLSDANANVEKDKMGYYTNTEVVPAYNGGQTALENYITNNIEYPQQAIDNSAEGTVGVHFLIDEKGNISNVSTVGNKIGYGLEEEAIRVVSKMSQWTPGKVKGKNVKTWRTLPITYKLEGS